MKSYFSRLQQALSVALLCLSVTIVQAQMRVGQPSGSPDPSAALDVSGGPYSSGSQYRGIAPPKVALTKMASAAPITKPVTGLLVYNTATSGEVTPGYYYWDGSQWARFNTTTKLGSARVEAVGGNGQPIPAYTVGQVQSMTFTNSTAPVTIILVESGKEGLFRYDASDTAPDDGVITLVATLNNLHYKRVIDGIVNVKWFGAKGDGITDDTQAIVNAVNSASTIVVFPVSTSYYKVSTRMAFNNLSRKKIIATGTRILNSDATKSMWQFQNGTDLEIEGGEFGYVNPLPYNESTSNEIVFQFVNSQRIRINNIHITHSPGMGVNFTACNEATVQNSHIEHTWRDGTYAQYSANIRVLHNMYNDVKDDAISFHDYGRDNQRTFIAGLGFGYNQATNWTVEDNTIRNTIQGITSIGSTKIKITNNNIKNTVNAGIGIWNSKELYADGTALAKDVQVIGNILENTCTTAAINGNSYSNMGQAGTGRAAIFIGSLGGNNQVNNGESKRLSNVQVSNNTVVSSGADGFFGYLVDGLQLSNNVFMNSPGTFYPVEISSVTLLRANNNSILDMRNSIQHQHGYVLNSVTGYSESWNVVGTIQEEATIVSSTLTNDALNRRIPQPLGFLDSSTLPNSSTSTDWNTLKSAGSYQVAGANGWSNAVTHSPKDFGVANAGTLTIDMSGDTETQTYTDYLGNRVWRHLNGLSSTAWSEWTSIMTQTTLDSKRIPQSRITLYSQDSTDWNTLKSAGSYQVAGTGWNPATTTTHSPKDYNVANAGTLTIDISGDTETQTYTDYLGNRTWRHLNGLSSNNWSPWTSMAVFKSDFKVGSAQQSGDGVTKSFAISHGLGVQPSYVSVEAATPDADKSNIQYITADATSIIIHYKTAPQALSGNLVWYWSARK